MTDGINAEIARGYKKRVGTAILAATTQAAYV